MAAFRRRVHMSNSMHLRISLVCFLGLYFVTSMVKASALPDQRVKRAALNKNEDQNLHPNRGENILHENSNLGNANGKGFRGGDGHPQVNNPEVVKMEHPPMQGGFKAGHKSAKLQKMKISESKECAEDVQKYCNNKGIADNNFAQLDCLQNDLKVDEHLSDECHHFLWQYKKNLTTDERFSFASAEVCNEELKVIAECRAAQGTKGHLIPCLLDHKENITSHNCIQFLNKMASIVFSDYRLVYNFVQTCEPSIQKFRCGRLQRTKEEEAEDEMAHSQGHTFDCLAKHLTDLDDSCKLQLLRVAELQADDYHFDRPLYYACRDAREIFCASTPAGDGQIYKCLYKHKMDPKMNHECREQLVKRQKLIAEDVKVDKSFFQACKKDIKENECFKHLPKGLEAGRSTVLLCLENVHKKGQTISEECLAEMEELRESLMEDYQITPDIVSKCHQEIERSCGNTLHKGGETLHCLMDLARPKHRKGHDPHASEMSHECKRELEDLLKEADVGENYMMDVALQRACQSVVETECKDISPGDSRILGCLMEKLDTDRMTRECGEKLLEIQYFVSRDFRLDNQLYKMCHKDAEHICGMKGDWLNPHNPDEPSADPGQLILPCLYRHFKKVEGLQVSKDCRHEVKRVMRLRAKNVDLMPEIEDKCLQDLAHKCSTLEDYNKGEEMKCLEDNYDDLEPECKKAVGDFIEEEDEDLDLDIVLKNACTPMIQKFCGDIDDDADAFEILDCLIEHKHHHDMNSKCAAGVEHHQIISLKDVRFSHKFKEQCKDYVNKFCSNRKKTKMEIVTCLSEIVRNDTLFGKSHRIEKPCRKQLKAQLLQREESITLDPVLNENCAEDISTFCPDVHKGNAKVIECLRRKQAKLSPKCHKTIFQREKVDMTVVDYTLQKACKSMIKLYCDDVDDPSQVLPCLRAVKTRPEFDPVCRKVVIQRQIIQNKDYRINPSLQKACHRDIPKFCSDLLKDQEEDEEMEGKVINCLKKEFLKRRLSTDCSNEIQQIMKEAAGDYRQDPVLAGACKEEIVKHCKDELEEMKNDEVNGKGLVEECLKNRFHDKVLKNARCIKEVARLVQEGHIDIHIDVDLYRTCMRDLSRHCHEVTPGEGKLMACLLGTLEDKAHQITPNCRKMLQGRKDMWEYAAQVAPIGSFSEIAAQISLSPSRNYILGILVSIVGIIFIMGITCGRVTKRITREMKNR